MKIGFYKSLIGGALVMAMVMSSCLSACQPTPEKPIVNAGDDTVLNDKIEATPVPAPETPTENLSSIYGFPTEYKDVFTCMDTDVNVNVSMKINVPDVQKAPVVEAEPTFVTSEMVKAFTEKMHPGFTFYDMREVFTKEDCEVKIEELQNIISLPFDEFMSTVYGGRRDDVEGGKQVLEERKEELESYRKLLPTLPESYEQSPTDFSFHPYIGYYEFLSPALQSAMENIEGSDEIFKDRVFLILTSALENGLTAYIDVENRDKKDEMLSQFEYAVGKIGIDGGYPSIPDSELRECTLTEQEMIDLGQNVLDCLGLSDAMVLDSIQKVDDYKYTWSLKYCRNVSGFDVGEVYIENDYNYVVGNESLEILIKNDMVTNVVYKNPCIPKNTENENVELISFEEAYAAFKRQAELEFTKASLSGWYTEVNGEMVPSEKGILSMNVTIKRADLVLVRIPIKDGGYRYVPAWQFIGNRQVEQDTSLPYDLPDLSSDEVTLMTINAVDGTRIAGLS